MVPRSNVVGSLGPRAASELDRLRIRSAETASATENVLVLGAQIQHPRHLSGSMPWDPKKPLTGSERCRLSRNA